METERGRRDRPLLNSIKGIAHKQGVRVKRRGIRSERGSLGLGRPNEVEGGGYQLKMKQQSMG